MKKKKLPFYTDNLLKDYEYDWCVICSEYELTEKFLYKYSESDKINWSYICWYGFENFDGLSDKFLIQYHKIMYNTMKNWVQDYQPYIDKRINFVKLLSDRGIMGVPKYFKEL